MAIKFQKKIVMRKNVIILGIITIFIGGCGQTIKKQATTEITVDSETIDSVEWVSENSEKEECFITEHRNPIHTNAAELFLKYLMNEEGLQLLFSDNWTFIYHADDRCDGSTDGQISNLSPYNVDEIIRIKVINDGEGWLCDKKEPKEYYLDFSLKERVKDWDRFEIPNY